MKKLNLLLSLTIALVASLSARDAKASTTGTNMVISEVYGGGGNSGATYKNDFVVLFNQSSSPIDITGWSVQYASSTGTAIASIGPLTNNLIVPAGGYYLVECAPGAGGTTDLPTPDTIATNISISGTTGKIYLINTTTKLGGACTLDATVVDFVGWGSSASCSEGSPAPGTSNTTSDKRNNDCVDTDNNANDFTAGAPTPRNSSTPLNPCSGSGGPVGISIQPQSQTNNAGSTVIFTAAGSGSGPYTYKWHKNLVDLTSDGTHILGADTASLTISNVTRLGDAGDYTVTISNPTPSSTNSAAAHLTVIEPIMVTQPVSRTNAQGDTMDLFASVAGSSPISFTWYHGTSTVVVSGVSNSATAVTAIPLDITNSQAGTGGNYFLVASNAYGAVTSSVAVATIFITPSTRLARWDFNAPGLNVNSPTTSEGTGNALLLGGVVGSFNPGTFSDIASVLGLSNEAWHTTTYPAAAVGNETAGVQFNVPTTGQQGIVVTWEQRHSNTASKYFRFRYTTDGSTFNEGPLLTMGVTNNSFIFYSADLSSVTAANNNANFGFQIVTAFEPVNNTNYVATTPGSTYGTAGTVRFDLVSVYGNTLGSVTPIPLHIQLAGTNAVLTWTDPTFSLQSSLVVTGGYSTIVPSSSPYTNAVTGKKFFRLMHP